MWNAAVKEGDAAGFRVNRFYNVLALLIVEQGLTSPIETPFRVGIVKYGTKTFRVVIAMNGWAVPEVVGIHIHALYIEGALRNVVINYGREFIEWLDRYQGLFVDMRNPEAEGVARVGFLSELVGGLMDALEDSVHQFWRYQVVVDL